MTTKLDLVTQSLLNKLGNGDSDEAKKLETETTIKSFACDLLNMVQGLNEKKADRAVIKSMAKEYGVDYNLKTKKFS